MSNFADMSIQDYNIQPVADSGNPGVVVGASEGSGAPRKVFLYVKANMKMSKDVNDPRVSDDEDFYR